MKTSYLLCINPVLILAWFVVFLAPSMATAQESESAIEVNTNTQVDAQIEERITQILNQIDGLSEVSVMVESGVVTLSGDVANEEQAQSALQIASRTVGVVQVIDNINRTLSISDNVEPLLADFEAKARGFVRALPLTLLALGVTLVFIFIASLVARWHWLWRKIAPNPFVAELLSQAVRIAIVATGIVIALTLVGASRFITTILGGAGVAGIAIGFAVRDTLENYISSIMLSLRQPFRAQDHVVINDYEGYVVRLTSRATILMTLDGNHLRIPNSVVFKGIILNYTTNPERRFDFTLGVDANDDPLQAMQVGLNAISANDFILIEPGPGAVLSEVGDSSIVLRFTAWVDQSKHSFGKARSASIKAAMTALEDQGFTLPEPIYRLRFDGQAAALTETVAKQNLEEEKSNDKASPREPIPDVSLDDDMREKLEEERARDAQGDLLDNSQPTE